MDIESLKEALGDEKFKALQTFVNDLIGQRDTARNESITGRKGKQTTIDAQAKRIEALENYVGIEAGAELESLPPLKQQLDAAKSSDAKLKRTERERDDAVKQRDEATGKFRSSLQRAAVAEAMSGHKFVARDIVETHVTSHLVWEGDELLFKTGDGKLVPVKDGVAGIAKTRPELLEPVGAGGAGFKGSNAGGGGASKTMTRSEWDASDHSKRSEFSKAGGQVVDA